MQNHQNLSMQVTRQHLSKSCLLVTFDLQLVPVAQEHGVDVVEEVWSGEQDVGLSEPVSEQETGSISRK